MTVLEFTQGELADHVYNAVMQPVIGGAAPTALEKTTARGQRDRVTSLLRACPDVLNNASDDELLKINLVMGGAVPAANLTPQTRSALIREIRSEVGTGGGNFFAGDIGFDFPDASNPKWASSTEGVADIVTALGPIVTLITIIVQGEALNRTAVINLATGALAVWCVMILIYFLAKVPGIFGDAGQDFLPEWWQGENEKVFRNFLLFLVSILGIAFLLLQGTIVSIGFKTKFDV